MGVIMKMNLNVKNERRMKMGRTVEDITVDSDFADCLKEIERGLVLMKKNKDECVDYSECLINAKKHLKEFEMAMMDGETGAANYHANKVQALMGFMVVKFCGEGSEKHCRELG